MSDIAARVNKLLNNNINHENLVIEWYNRYTTDNLPINNDSTPKYISSDSSNINEDQRLVNAYDSEIVENRVNYIISNPVIFEYVDENEVSQKRNQELINNWIKEDGFMLKLRDLLLKAGACGSCGLLMYMNKDSNGKSIPKSQVVAPWEYVLEWDKSETEVVGALKYWSVDEIVGTEVNTTNGSKTETKTVYYGEYYDGSKIYYMKGNAKNSLVVEREEVDLLGIIPLLETLNNIERKPSFYKAISLIDAYNRIISDFSNEMVGFRHAILALYGAVLKGENDTDDDLTAARRIKELRMLYLEEGSKAEYITKEIKYEDSEFILKQLEKNIERFTGHLNYADPEVYGRATNLAIKTRIKPLENKAKALIMHLDETLQNMFKILGNYFNAFSGNDFDWRKVVFNFTLDTPLNDVEEAEKLVKLGSLFSKKTVFTQASFIDDPDAEIEQIEKELEDEITPGDDFERRQEPIENTEDE